MDVTEEQINEAVDEVMDRLSEDVDVERENVKSRFETFVTHEVPPREAIDSVINNLAEEAGISREELVGEQPAGEGGGGEQGPPDKVDVRDIESEDEWVTLEARVVELWDNDNDAISQVGLLDDGSGRIKFVSWEKSDVPLLNEGDDYRFENAVTSEYEGRYSVNFNANTEVSFLEEDELDLERSETIQGAFVHLKQGSGLILRDEDDNVIDDADEAEDPEHDLRLKAVIDAGEEVYGNVYFNKELTEELTGMELDEAVQLATDKMDMDAVMHEMKDDVLGRYYELECTNIEGSYIVQDYEVLGGDDNLETVLAEARGL